MTTNDLLDVVAEVIHQKNTETRKYFAECLASLEKKMDTAGREVYVTIDQRPSVKVSGTVHQCFDKVCKCLGAKMPVYLHGPAGSGKNVICEQVANAFQLPFYMSSTLLQKYELLGYGDAQGNYIETSFYKAFVNGGVFMLDEFDGCSPEVAIALNAALANGYIDFPVVGMKKAHNDFYCIAAGNTVGRGASEAYNGRFALDAATLDRFTFIAVDYDSRIEYECSGGDTELCEFIRDVRRASKENGMVLVAGYRAISRIAKLNKMGFELNEVLEMSLFKGMDADELQMIEDNVSSRKYRDAIKLIRFTR